MIVRLLLLAAGALAFWVLTALPARHLGGGDVAVLHAGTAVLLCLLPAALTLAWASRALAKDPQQQLTAVLGATGVRMFAVLLAGWLLVENVPVYREQGSFWTWLLVSYLFVLALEMTLLLAGRREARGPVEGA